MSNGFLCFLAKVLSDLICLAALGGMGARAQTAPWQQQQQQRFPAPIPPPNNNPAPWQQQAFSQAGAIAPPPPPPPGFMATSGVSQAPRPNLPAGIPLGVPPPPPPSQ